MPFPRKYSGVNLDILDLFDWYLQGVAAQNNKVSALSFPD
jgi:hypothetical protein